MAAVTQPPHSRAVVPRSQVPGSQALDKGGNCTNLLCLPTNGQTLRTEKADARIRQNTFKSARRQRVETGDTAEHHLEEFLSQRRMEVWESKGTARRENCLKEVSIALEWGEGEQAAVYCSCCISLV